MDAWGKDLKVGDKVTMLADPQGKFVKDLELDFDASGTLQTKSYRGYIAACSDERRNSKE